MKIFHPERFLGKQFGRLTIIELVGFPPNRKARCVCECGNGKTISLWGIARGVTRSCGCLRDESSSKRMFRHGESGVNGTREYHIWNAMLGRCRLKKQRYYKNYGGRGIQVCERWHTYENFLADMGRRPSAKHSLERLNNDGNYEPPNCVWADKITQCNNTRVNHFIEWRGKRLTVTQWARELGIHTRTLRARLFAYHWPIDRAFSEPVNVTFRPFKNLPAQ